MRWLQSRAVRAGWALVAATMVLGSASAQDAAARYDRRWFYAAQNLLVDQNVDELIGLIERAGKSHYNGMLLADYKFNILERMPANYFRNVAKVRAAAERAGIEIIPAVFPIGYSNGLLAHDPNLAEGVPVTNEPFLVKGKEAVLDPSAAPQLRNGDLEETRGDRFAGFAYQDDPGRATFADSGVAHHGQVSCRMEKIGTGGSSPNCRLVQRVKLRPHACYRYSCWVKSLDFHPTGEFRLTAISAGEHGRTLTFGEPAVPPTSDWTRIEIVFNSLDHAEVSLYAGVWGKASGMLWLDDFELEELVLVNVLRREGCPLVVASADGKTEYTEGRDYEPVRDPELGQDPYAGEYSFAHPGASLRLTAQSQIKNGAHLRVSWYHPVLTHQSQVMCCLSEPKVYDLLKDQAKRVNDLLHPSTFFMSHDEIRVANWCKACQARGMTPGGLLADNARRCVEILKQLNPRVRIVVWSDMFDPNHNAVDHYYLVNGTLKDSWEGLSPDVIVANWNSGKAKESLNFFAGRGHFQILAGYYDDGVGSFRDWDQARAGVPKVIGFLYTTWQQKYGDLETYGRLMAGH